MHPLQNLLGNSERDIASPTVSRFCISDNQNAWLVAENPPNFFGTEVPKLRDFRRGVVTLGGTVSGLFFNALSYRLHALFLEIALGAFDPFRAIGGQTCVIVGQILRVGLLWRTD